MKKILKNILLLIIISTLLAAGGYYWLYTQSQEKKLVTKNAESDLAMITTGRAAQLYGLTSAGMQSSITKEDFVKKFGVLSSNLPNFLPSKLTKEDGKYLYHRRVENLPKTVGDRTNADFTLEYINEKGWKLHAVTVE